MYNNQNSEYAGVPYDDINWYDIEGQPFGTASYFNAMILKDADNIVDTKGAMAVGGDFFSSRGLSLGYGNDGNLAGTGYSPNLVRFLVGGNVSMQGPLVVIGHVVADGNFKAARGSTYMIGKDGSPTQVNELTELYRADGGSKYWGLSDRGAYYVVPSYDVPRYIPAQRINADTQSFFRQAEESITNYHNCITALQPNGMVTEHYHEWILSGNDPRQNVFLIDVRPNGILNKEIRFEIPRGSLAIVIMRTGANAHLQYGLWGEKALANHTLYVFEDAENIYMDVPAAIWGSILAPKAIYHAHTTGGTVNGNAVLGSLEMNATTGFEFHLFPFVGGVICRTSIPMPTPPPVEIPEQIPTPPLVEIPELIPTPPLVEIPELIPPPPAPAPAPTPRPVIPTPAPRPVIPQPVPRPEVMPCPPPIPCPPPTPCPQPTPCPECPPTGIVRIQPIPIPIPIPCPEQEKCEECLITPGVIFGCIWGCDCHRNHEWEIRLYKKCGDSRTLIYCITICNCGCFEFNVPFDDFYLLVVRPVESSSHRHKRQRSVCKPMISLKNVGVTNLMIE